MVVEGEVGIAQGIPAMGGDFEDLGLAIEEVESDGLERVAASGDPLVDWVGGAEWQWARASRMRRAARRGHAWWPVGPSWRVAAGRGLWRVITHFMGNMGSGAQRWVSAVSGWWGRRSFRGEGVNGAGREAKGRPLVPIVA